MHAYIYIYIYREREIDSHNMLRMSDRADEWLLSAILPLLTCLVYIMLIHIPNIT